MMVPHPLTIASIELAGSWWHLDAKRRYNCGCDHNYHPTRPWQLCQYHKGYNDGVEAATRANHTQ